MQLASGPVASVGLDASPIAGAASVVPASGFAVATGCARRVKVIYQGYGEADRASGCGAPAVEAAR